MKKPTKKPLALLEFITEFTKTNNFSPSYREIMRALHLNSVSAVAEHIDNCVSVGLLKKKPGAARSLEVIKPKSFTTTKKDLNEAIKILEKQGKIKATTVLQEAIKILTELTD